MIELKDHPLYEYLKANAPLFVEYEAKYDELWEKKHNAQETIRLQRGEGYRALYQQLRAPLDQYDDETHRLHKAVSDEMDRELEAFAKALLQKAGVE